jgi:hypothetical protein
MLSLCGACRRVNPCKYSGFLNNVVKLAVRHAFSSAPVKTRSSPQNTCLTCNCGGRCSYGHRFIMTVRICASRQSLTACFASCLGGSTYPSCQENHAAFAVACSADNLFRQRKTQRALSVRASFFIAISRLKAYSANNAVFGTDKPHFFSIRQERPLYKHLNSRGLRTDNRHTSAFACQRNFINLSINSF